jgi:hypothetical protein
MEAAADQMVGLLTDAHAREEMVEQNFQVARQFFSLASLRGYLEPLLAG